MNPRERILQLIEQLNKYSDSYYNDNISLISDKEYDQLFDELKYLEEKTSIIYANSPTQRVGYSVIGELNKVNHDHPLLSLGKTTDICEFYEFFQNRPVVISAKMDGLTCSLLYRDGKLISGESRGNGEIGEDITHNVRTFINLPQQIPFDGKLIIDGECIIDYPTFEKIKESEGIPYKNPRNLVSGTVRQLDSSVCARRKVRFIAWKLYSAENPSGSLLPACKSFKDGFEFLKGLGFEVAPYLYEKNEDDDKENNPEKFRKNIECIREKCENQGLPIDGICGAFDDVDYGLSLGATSHHPRHSLAFKFYQERNETTLLDVEWSTTRTGLVNPVAILEPVEIDGTTVSRASLSNISIIKELKLGIGDTVSVIKANQIIPQITENLTCSGNYLIPEHCPSCGEKLVIQADTGRESLLCINENCIGRKLDSLANFVGRNGMDIAGLSIEKLRILYLNGMLKDFSDIYRLRQNKEELLVMDGFGDLSIDNLLDSIEKSRQCKFSDFLVAFGIPQIGRASAKSLVKYLLTFPDVYPIEEKFEKMAELNYDWTIIDDFGEITRDAINSYFSDWKELYLKTTFFLDFSENHETIPREYLPLTGQTLCITGKLERYENRDALVREIENLGGRFVSSVSPRTSFLICNDSDSQSSKKKKADEYKITILTEEEFIEKWLR